MNNPYMELLKKLEMIRRNSTYGTEMYVNPPRHCGKSAAMDLWRNEFTYEGETRIPLDRAMYSVAEELGLDIRVDKCEGYPSTEYKYISHSRGFAIKIMVPKYALNVMVRETRWIQVVSSFIRRNHAAYCMCADNRIFDIYDILGAEGDRYYHYLEQECSEIDDERIKDSVARYRARSSFEMVIDDLPFAPLDLDKLNAAITTLEERTNTMMPEIKNVMFNNPATIVFWGDGTKTVVKAENEPFDPEKGLAMAITKKTLGNKGSYYNEFKKWIK